MNHLRHAPYANATTSLHLPPFSAMRSIAGALTLLAAVSCEPAPQPSNYETDGALEDVAKVYDHAAVTP